jgi:hypothetical protein
MVVLLSAVRGRINKLLLGVHFRRFSRVLFLPAVARLRGFGTNDRGIKRGLVYGPGRSIVVLTDVMMAPIARAITEAGGKLRLEAKSAHCITRANTSFA